MILLVSLLLFCLSGNTLVYSQLTTSTVPGTCETALDCCLLGSCIKGICVCDQGFTGPNCQTFDIIPSNLASIEGWDSPEYPAWGGLSIYADGEYHFIGSYMENQCAITSYGTNSAFFRATASYPLGPFTWQEELFVPFHNGAQVARAVDKSYLIFGDGRDMPASTVQTNCNPNQLPQRVLSEVNEEKHPQPILRAHLGEKERLLKKSKKKKEEDKKSLNGASNSLYPLGDSPNDVHFVYYSTSILGPWTRFEITPLQTNIDEFDSWNCNKTNPAPLILSNGTVVMGYRSKSCVSMSQQSSSCGRGCQNIGIAVSEDGPTGNYVLRPSRIAPLDGNEDPFLWENSRGYLMVMHGKLICGSSQADINTCGALAYSLDSYTWYLSPFPAYTGTVTFNASVRTDTETLFARQRPKIMFSNEGVPMVLYNAGQRYTDLYCRNFAFAFNVIDMTDYQAPPPCPPPGWTNVCTTFVRDDYTYNHTRNGCEMISAASDCIWCDNEQLCMPGSDPRICQASSIAVYYAHC